MPHFPDFVNDGIGPLTFQQQQQSILLHFTFVKSMLNLDLE